MLSHELLQCRNPWVESLFSFPLLIQLEILDGLEAERRFEVILTFGLAVLMLFMFAFRTRCYFPFEISALQILSEGHSQIFLRLIFLLKILGCCWFIYFYFHRFILRICQLSLAVFGFEIQIFLFTKQMKWFLNVFNPFITAN